MRFKQRKAEPSEIRDPQLEYARLARQTTGQNAARMKSRDMFPPPAVDADFCFAEDAKK
jgi:hypothetical protein